MLRKVERGAVREGLVDDINTEEGAGELQRDGGVRDGEPGPEERQGERSAFRVGEGKRDDITGGQIWEYVTEPDGEGKAEVWGLVGLVVRSGSQLFSSMLVGSGSRTTALVIVEIPAVDTKMTIVVSVFVVLGNVKLKKEREIW